MQCDNAPIINAPIINAPVGEIFAYLARPRSPWPRPL